MLLQLSSIVIVATFVVVVCVVVCVVVIVRAPSVLYFSSVFFDLYFFVSSSFERVFRLCCTYNFKCNVFILAFMTSLFVNKQLYEPFALMFSKLSIFLSLSLTFCVCLDHSYYFVVLCFPPHYSFFLRWNRFDLALDALPRLVA